MPPLLICLNLGLNGLIILLFLFQTNISYSYCRLLLIQTIVLQLVRNSALFALGQFAEHLQPDISKYHAELLPVLFDYLTQVGGMLMDFYFCYDML